MKMCKGCGLPIIRDKPVEYAFRNYCRTCVVWGRAVPEPWGWGWAILAILAFLTAIGILLYR